MTQNGAVIFMTLSVFFLARPFLLEAMPPMDFYQRATKIRQEVWGERSWGVRRKASSISIINAGSQEGRGSVAEGFDVREHDISALFLNEELQDEEGGPSLSHDLALWISIEAINQSQGGGEHEEQQRLDELSLREMTEGALIFSHQNLLLSQYDLDQTNEAIGTSKGRRDSNIFSVSPTTNLIEETQVIKNLEKEAYTLTLNDRHQEQQAEKKGEEEEEFSFLQAAFYAACAREILERAAEPGISERRKKVCLVSGDSYLQAARASAKGMAQEAEGFFRRALIAKCSLDMAVKSTMKAKTAEEKEARALLADYILQATQAHVTGREIGLYFFSRSASYASLAGEIFQKATEPGVSEKNNMLYTCSGNGYLLAARACAGGREDEANCFVCAAQAFHRAAESAIPKVKENYSLAGHYYDCAAQASGEGKESSSYLFFRTAYSLMSSITLEEDMAELGVLEERKEGHVLLGNDNFEEVQEQEEGEERGNDSFFKMNTVEKSIDFLNSELTKKSVLEDDARLSGIQRVVEEEEGKDALYLKATYNDQEEVKVFYSTKVTKILEKEETTSLQKKETWYQRNNEVGRSIVWRGI